jgi:phage repressor protein C with HTH and peptisase S24 domain
MDTTLAQRLTETRQDAGLTQTQLAKRVGCSQALIGNLESGNQKSSTHLPKIAAALGVEVLWLQHGTGPKRREQGAPAASLDLDTMPGLVAVPRVRFKLSAGVSGFAVEPENGNGKPIYFRDDWFQMHNYRPEKLFSVRVAGASMEPSLWDGDLVVVNTDDTKPHDGDVFAVNYEGELTIKRLRRDAGDWWATSDNSDQRRFAPKRCTEDVQLIGRIIYKQSERI